MVERYAEAVEVAGSTPARSIEAMKIRITIETTTTKKHNVCCFTGDFQTTEVTLRVGDELECAGWARGEKQKGGRVNTLFVDSGTLHPDCLTVPERNYEVVEV